MHIAREHSSCKHCFPHVNTWAMHDIPMWRAAKRLQCNVSFHIRSVISETFNFSQMCLIWYMLRFKHQTKIWKAISICRCACFAPRVFHLTLEQIRSIGDHGWTCRSSSKPHASVHMQNSAPFLPNLNFSEVVSLPHGKWLNAKMLFWNRWINGYDKLWKGS
jgi:hypothetical protein